MRSIRALAPLLPLLAPLCLGAVVFDAACSDGTLAPGGDAGASTGATDAAWDHPRAPYDGTGGPTVQRVPVSAEVVSTHVDVQSLMFAAGEMQISGEPFAQFFAGRNLANYDRAFLPTDQYKVGDPENPKPLTDLFGFSTAVESYEYSKYHMNMIVQMTGAGVSLGAGPLVLRIAKPTAAEKLQQRAFELLSAAGTDVGGYAVLPAPANNPKNLLGFSGLVPTFAPYKSFNPAMQPHLTVVRTCAGGGGYGGIPTLGQVTPEYECEYTSLHIADTQLDHVLVPGVLGLATWKQALWSIDFAGRIHDSGSNPVNAVAPADRASVGAVNNLVVATDPPGAAAGTYLGSTPLEGMWGLLMVAGMDNLAEWLVSSLTTADGTSLGGFATKLDALSYDYTSPLRWFPAAVNVAVDATQAFPPVTSLTIADAKSRSEDLAGLLLGHAMFFAMTDARNAGIGRRIGLQLTFDGDPFPPDNGLADGEETAHDRALAILRVAFVDLDRMHADPALGIITDTATVAAGTVTRGATVTTTSLAHVVIALRQTLLSVNAAITQYGAVDPDPAADAKGVLNAAAIHPPGGGTPTFSARVRSVLAKNATFVRDVLTAADGRVFNGAAIAGGVATPAAGAATIESQSSALRALVEGFLVTNDESFRERARAVARRLHAGFYSAAARMFRGVDGGDDQIRMTPERFAWLQSALRETHKVLYVQQDATLGREALEGKIARANKLFLNGWDDLNGNETVEVASECLKGRLQLAEQSLTGELGRDDLGRPVVDRDGDCVPELAHAKNASVLASEVLFHGP